MSRRNSVNDLDADFVYAFNGGSMTDITVASPRRVEWECDLFGLDCYTLHLEEGRKYPNWFWRKMQYLVLGNRWRRVVPRGENP